jgi:ribosomal protein S18 acetylase RimI-like enzyme
MISVKTVSADDEDTAIRTIVAAFRDDPIAQWFYPDARQYAEVFPSFVKAFAGGAFAHNSAYCTADGCAAALWLPPGIHPDARALETILEDTIPEPRRPRVRAFTEQMDTSHPEEPHWYLPMIGVMPHRHGHGYGSALLKHALERCDVEGKLAYLEASSTNSVPLYRRHGFELLGTIQVGSSPPLFPMMREPRPVHDKIRQSPLGLETTAGCQQA